MSIQIKLESVEKIPVFRKFAVVYMLSSVLPLVVLFVFYLFINWQKPVGTDTLILPLFLVAIFGMANFFFMRQSLTQLHSVSSRLREALNAPVPREISLPLPGGPEVAMIVDAFNELVKRLETNISELEKSRHMLLQALEREQMLASTDNLTGIANRRVFYELTAMEIHKSRRYNRPFTVMLMDVDNFKHVNDSMGHQKGDVLLCAIARCIKESVRNCDVAARLGGDEFAVLLAEAGREVFNTVIPRIRDRLAGRVDADKWPVTFSIGVAVFNSAPENVDEIMRKVDSLMYDIKRAGKNNLKFDEIG